jgi:hypothetical protein
MKTNLGRSPRSRTSRPILQSAQRGSQTPLRRSRYRQPVKLKKSAAPASQINRASVPVWLPLGWQSRADRMAWDQAPGAITLLASGWNSAVCARAPGHFSRRCRQD